METNYEKKYHQLEIDYWWFVARRDIIKGFLKSYSKGSKILELGCSGGILIKELNEGGFTNVYGLDISKEAIDKCKEKGIKNVKAADAIKTGFKDKEFDIIIASDVLEHIKDENKAVNEWKRLLKPNGTLIVFVPAFMSLWSKHDEINHHFKRYRNKEFVHVFDKYFKIIKKGYWNFSLFFPMFLIRRFKNGGDDLKETKLNNVLLLILKIENWLIKKGLRFPVGISTFIIAKNIN